MCDVVLYREFIACVCLLYISLCPECVHMCDVILLMEFIACVCLLYTLFCPGSNILRKAGREPLVYHFINLKSKTQRG